MSSNNKFDANTWEVMCDETTEKIKYEDDIEKMTDKKDDNKKKRRIIIISVLVLALLALAIIYDISM